MIPAVTVPPSPNGLPIASTQSPTRALLESPQLAAGSGDFGSTLSSARSVTESRPMTCACNAVSSDRVTVICSALAITWLLVTINPDGSMTNPEPSEAIRGPGAPGAPFSPKKSRNTSSSVLPGEFGGVSCAVLAVGGAAWVEILTTTPTSRPASWANISENGPSGGSARAGVTIPGATIPGATIIAHTANEAATTAPRRRKTLTLISPRAGKARLLLPTRI